MKKKKSNKNIALRKTTKKYSIAEDKIELIKLNVELCGNRRQELVKL